MSLMARLEEVARRQPDRPALSCGANRLTYARLLAQVDRRAAALAGAERLVSLDGSNPETFLVDFFAARRRRLPAVSHPPAIPAALRELRDRTVRAADTHGLQDATIFYSSGSVGLAKAVPLSDDNLAAAALAFESWGEVGPHDRLAVGLSPAQVFGFVRGALNALLVGAEVVFFSPRRDPLREAESLGATAVLLPSALLALAARHPSPVRLSAVRCGGGTLSEPAADLIENERGVPVRSGYGMTESSGLAARQRGSRPRRHGSSGCVAPGIEISIVGEDGRECAPGESGEIRLRGAAVFSGYLSAEDESPFDAQGRLRTGDVGYLDAEGELCVRGRLAFSISSGDRVLCAEEVEAAIAEHPGVAEAAAAPFDRSFGVLVVLNDSSPSEALLEEIREQAQRRLPGFARPRRFLSVEEIPRTAAGKVDRIAASQWLSSGRTGA